MSFEFIKSKDKVCLTSSLKLSKIERDNVVYVRTMSQEIHDDRLDRENSNNEENPYESIITMTLKRLIYKQTFDKWEVFCT